MGWGMHYSVDGNVIFVASESDDRVDISPYHAEMASFALSRAKLKTNKSYEVSIPTKDGGQFAMVVEPSNVPVIIMDLQEMANKARQAIGQKPH